MKDIDPLYFERLVDWLDGRLPPEEAATIAQQVAADEAVQADVAWLQTILGHHLVLVEPPADLHQQLAQRFAAYRQRHVPANLFPRFTAQVLFDSHSQGAVAGIRAAAPAGQERQLIYASETADIALTIFPRPTDEQVDLVGQVFPLSEGEQEAYSVQLLQAAIEQNLTTTDELGEFTFRGLLPGHYDLVLSGSQAEVVLTAVDLRP